MKKRYNWVSEDYCKDLARQSGRTKIVWEMLEYETCIREPLEVDPRLHNKDLMTAFLNKLSDDRGKRLATFRQKCMETNGEVTWMGGAFEYQLAEGKVVAVKWKHGKKQVQLAEGVHIDPAKKIVNNFRDAAAYIPGAMGKAYIINLFTKEERAAYTNTISKPALARIVDELEARLKAEEDINSSRRVQVSEGMVVASRMSRKRKGPPSEAPPATVLRA